MFVNVQDRLIHAESWTFRFPPSSTEICHFLTHWLPFGYTAGSYHLWTPLPHPILRHHPEDYRCRATIGYGICPRR